MFRTAGNICRPPGFGSVSSGPEHSRGAPRWDTCLRTVPGDGRSDPDEDDPGSSFHNPKTETFRLIQVVALDPDQDQNRPDSPDFSKPPSSKRCAALGNLQSPEGGSWSLSWSRRFLYLLSDPVQEAALMHSWDVCCGSSARPALAGGSANPARVPHRLLLPLVVLSGCSGASTFDLSGLASGGDGPRESKLLGSRRDSFGIDRAINQARFCDFMGSRLGERRR